MCLLQKKEAKDMSSAPISSIMLLTIQHILQVVVHGLGKYNHPHLLEIVMKS